MPAPKAGPPQAEAACVDLGLAGGEGDRRQHVERLLDRIDRLAHLDRLYRRGLAVPCAAAPSGRPGTRRPRLSPQPR
jgi:hypothetical protein